MTEKTKYTYANLLTQLQQLTPEQLAVRVRWCGDQRGGVIDGIEILKEDQCNPSGDGWEPKSEVIKQQIEQGETETVAQSFAEYEIVCRAGTPLLIVDGVADELEPCGLVSDPADEKQ